MNFDPAFIVTHGMHITKRQWKTTTKQRWKKKKHHLTTPMARQSWPMGGLSEVKGERHKIENTELQLLLSSVHKVSQDTIQFTFSTWISCEMFRNKSPHRGEPRILYNNSQFSCPCAYHHVFWYCYRPHICHAEGTCRQNAFQEVSSLMKLVFVLCQRKDEPDNQGLPLA